MFLRPSLYLLYYVWNNLSLRNNVMTNLWMKKNAIMFWLALLCNNTFLTFTLSSSRYFSKKKKSTLQNVKKTRGSHSLDQFGGSKYHGEFSLESCSWSCWSQSLVPSSLYWNNRLYCICEKKKKNFGPVRNSVSFIYSSFTFCKLLHKRYLKWKVSVASKLTLVRCFLQQFFLSLYRF